MQQGTLPSAEGPKSPVGYDQGCEGPLEPRARDRVGGGQSWDGQESQCEPQVWGVSGQARPGDNQVRLLLPVDDTPSGPWELLRAMVLVVSLHVGSQGQWKGLLHHSQHSAGRLDRSGGPRLLRLLVASQGLRRVHGSGGHRRDPIDWVAGWTTEMARSHGAGPEGLPFSLRPRAHCAQQHLGAATLGTAGHRLTPEKPQTLVLIHILDPWPARAHGARGIVHSTGHDTTQASSARPTL